MKSSNTLNSLARCFGLLGCLAGVLLAGGCNNNEAELAQLRKENAELRELKTEMRALKEAQANNPELIRLRKENAEIYQLRNEIGKARQEAQQLRKLEQDARNQMAFRATNQAQQAQLTEENQKLRAALAQQQQIHQLQTQLNPGADVCINQLRQIQGAIEQWAVLNKKPANTPIAPAEVTAISAFLPGARVPQCPQGGGYTFHAVGVPPTCSFPGHAIPR